MTEIRITGTKDIWKDLFGFLNETSDEILLDIGPDGVKVQVTDPSHICMACVDIGKEAFSEYAVTDPNVFGLDIKKLTEQLRHCKDDVTIMFKDDGKVTMTSGKLRIGTRVLDKEKLTAPKMPKLTLPVSMDCKLEMLKDATKAMGLVSDCVVMALKDGNIAIDGKNEQDSITYDMSEITVESGEKSAKSSYSLNYLSNLVKSLPDLGGPIKVRFGTDYPVDVGCTDGVMTYRFLLAPRIADEK